MNKKYLKFGKGTCPHASRCFASACQSGIVEYTPSAEMTIRLLLLKRESRPDIMGYSPAIDCGLISDCQLGNVVSMKRFIQAQLKKAMQYRAWKLLPAPAKAMAYAWCHDPVFPPVMQMEPTRRCNLRCVMCALTQFYHGDKTKDMTLEEFKRVISQLPKSVELVTIQGTGEPLLNKEIVPMIEFACRQGFRTNFNTNLLLLTDEMANRLVAAGLSEVVVSIETAHPERYADIRRNGDIERFLANLDKLNEAKQRAGVDHPKITACCVMMKHTLPDIPDLITTLEQRGVVRLHLADMCTYPEYTGPLTLADGSDLRDQALGASMSEEEIWRELSALKALGTDKIEVTIPGDWGGIKIEKPDDGTVLTCIELWRLPFVKANSEMCTCCWAPQYVMGDFKTQTFEEIWFGKPYRRMRMLHLMNKAPAQCRKCQQRFYSVAVPSRIFGVFEPEFRMEEVFL